MSVNADLSTKVTDEINIHELKQSDEEYLFHMKFAQKTWNIKQNDFLRCRQFRSGKQFDKEIDLKSKAQVYSIFVENKENEC